jgi:DNA invertase Pin-like site-specific DNA recombinase
MNSLRFSIFCAVSTLEQARPDKFSLADQEERCRKTGRERGWREVSTYVVKGQSRTKHIQLDQAMVEIEPLRCMIHDARQRKFDILVLSEFDRLRDLLDQVFRTLAACRVQIYSLGQPVEPVAPEEYSLHKADSIVMSMLMSQTFSRLEISRFRRKWFEQMPKRITELGLQATSISYGYRKPEGQQHDRKAVPEQDPAITAHLIRIKDLFLAGHSTSQLIDYLEDHELPPPKGKRWYRQTIRDILRNPFYAGVVRFGASKVYVDPLTDQRKRNRHVSDDQVKQNTGRHKPLWDLDTHEAIRVELKRRAKNYRGRVNNEFTGLVVCGICRCAMWRHGNGPRGEHRLVWRCSSTGSARGHNAWFHTTLREKVIADLSRSFPQYVQRQRAPRLESKEDTSAARQLLDELHTRLERLEDAYLAGKWDLNRYTARKEQIDREISDAQETIRRVQDHASLQRAWVQDLNAMTQLQDIPRWFAQTDPVEINKTLQVFLKSIVVGEKIELVFK